MEGREVGTQPKSRPAQEDGGREERVGRRKFLLVTVEERNGKKKNQPKRLALRIRRRGSEMEVEESGELSRMLTK